MKYFVAIFLFAFVAGILAEDFLDNGGEPDRHPYVQCKIDLYDCMRLDKESNWECLKKYKTCMAQLLPTAPPPVVKCHIDLFHCIRQDRVGNLECLSRYKTCLGRELPAFIIACNQVLEQCENQASGYLGKLYCYKDFVLCVANGPTLPPSEVVMDAIEDGRQMEDFGDGLQCTKDFFSCLRSGKDVKVCGNAYGTCVKARVKRCNAKLKECRDAATNGLEKLKCHREHFICLINVSPSQAPTEPPTV